MTAVIPEAAVAQSGRVTLRAADVRARGGTADDTRAITGAIRWLHAAWAAGDVAAYTSRLASHAIRMAPETSELSVGRVAIAAALPREWEAFERRGGRLAVRLAVRDVDVSVRGDAAVVRSRVEVSGGSRWGFDDEWRVLQAFERTGERWLLVHETTASGLEPRDDGAGASPTFRFDFSYPVVDLARAVAFYRPLLGEPETVARDHATFSLSGGRFHLELGALGGRATVRPGLPNGYATIDVPSVDADPRDGPDRTAVATDPSGNVLVLRERVFAHDAAAPPPPTPTLSLARDTPIECASQVRTFASAFLRADSATVAALHTIGAALFDDRARSSSIALGRDAIRAATHALFARYDRSRHGLVAALDVRDVRVTAFGPGAIASYTWTLTSTGDHPMRETSFVTQVWPTLDGGAGSITDTFVVRTHPRSGIVRALDYTGYPVVSLAAAERYYTRVLELGEPYRDEAYRGWWSTDAVFGIYEASAGTDGIPTARRTNGYVSFWVRSAADTLAYLRAHGSSFPVIPAINTRAGIDREDGYTQVVATDSEGNVVLFTQY